MRRLNIGIAGAGPAGLAAALALHRAGHSVTVYDQFEAPKPIGSGLILQPTGLAVLNWLGLLPRMQRLGARIDKLYGKACGSDRVVLDVRYAALGAARGLAVHRAALFQVLHEAVREAGITVKGSSRIKRLQGTSLILNQDEKTPAYDVVIDALGSRSPLIPHAAGPDVRVKLPYGAIWASLPWPEASGFDPAALEQRYDRASVMIGVLPIGSRFEGDTPQTAFFWSLKAQDFAAWKIAGLEPWKDRVRALWPETQVLLETIQSTEQMTLAAYEHHTLVQPFGNKLVFIGDSAHSTSPQLGQGANMALLDVMALTEALERHDSLDTAFLAYARARRRHVKLYQLLSRMFTPFYQSDSLLLPLVRDTLVSSLSRLPLAQRVLANIVAGEFGR